MKITENTPCFLSQRGHNNFWYPRDEEGGVTYITQEIKNPEFTPWKCGNPNLRALLVPPQYLRDVYGDPETRIAVWVRIKDLKTD
mgnify:CR=1 FL=1|tara:strand:- start:294 stop:548 length:255 start_codon:yes stop_codon:yes gene_type:complete